MRTLGTLAPLILLAACSGYEYGNAPNAGSSRYSVTVTATYSLGTYNLANNLLDFGSDSSNDCTSASDCIQFGTARSVALSNESACADISVYIYNDDDTLNDIFDWSCASTALGLVLESSGFKDGMGIKDVIDWSASPLAFRKLKVKIYGRYGTYESDASTWWSDAITEKNSTFTSSLGHTIFAVPAGTTIFDPSLAVHLVHSHVALVMNTGAKVEATAAAGVATKVEANHVWLEGKFVGASGFGDAIAVNGLSGTHYKFLNVRNSTLSGADSALLYLKYTENSRFENLTLSNTSATPIVVLASSDNEFSDLNITATSSTTSVYFGDQGSDPSYGNHFTDTYLYNYVVDYSGASPFDESRPNLFDTSVSPNTGGTIGPATGGTGAQCAALGYAQYVTFSSYTQICGY